MSAYPPYVCVILAGGAARRMEGSAPEGLKTLLPLAGQPILEHICTALRAATPPPEAIALNIVTEQIPLAPEMPLALDAQNERQGPLAGISAGLNWCAQHHPDIKWMLGVSGDTPFLPNDLAAKLFEAAITEKKMLACAASHKRHHPTIALWSLSLRTPLEVALSQNVRKIDRFILPYSPAIVEWADPDHDPFWNINSPEDLKQAEQKILDSKGKM